jgi:benzylsuccinate CoA-transferase BbsF subunit
MPLTGTRILDLTRLGYGAQSTALLGALGAEVIRVESRTRPDPLRLMPPYVPGPGAAAGTGPQRITAETALAHGLNRGGIFHKYNFGGKRSVTLNLKHPRGLELLRRLVPLCDVLAESFAAGTLERMGLGYDALKRLRPDLVYVSMSGFGHTGRDRRHVTLGPTWPSEAPPFRLSATPGHAGGRIRRGPPCIGEDNAYVLGELLGVPDAEIVVLEEEGALA